MTEREAFLALREQYGRVLIKLIKLRAAVDNHRDTLEQTPLGPDTENTTYDANKRLWAAGKEAWRD